MLKIKNWSEFQHFRDRDPIWIKLYRKLLDDINWHELDGNDAKVLVMLWLLASEKNGELPPVNVIAYRLRLSEKLIKSTISRLSHFLYQDDINTIHDINTISDGYQDDSPHALAREEKRRDREENIDRAKALSTPEGVSLVVWQDFLKHRKAKKAPVTETSLAGIRREAEKAGWSLESALRECCTRGWQSFKADWVDKQTNQAIDPESRQAVEADGVAKGIGKWNEAAEQWSVYKRRVRGPEYPKNIAALVSAGIQRTAA